MGNLVLYAPPAAGKGTLCEKLEKDYGYSIISIGQVLRNNRNPETEIGKAIIETQDKGILTPDDIVAKALAIELEKYTGKPIVLEGYPRNISQAIALDKVLNNYSVIVIQISREEAMKRALGRVTCSNCHKIYNIYDKALSPKSVYEENAPTIIDYYQNKNILHLVDGSVTKDDIYNQVKEIIKGSKND